MRELGDLTAGSFKTMIAGTSGAVLLSASSAGLDGNFGATRAVALVVFFFLSVPSSSASISSSASASLESSSGICIRVSLNSAVAAGVPPVAPPPSLLAGALATLPADGGVPGGGFVAGR